METPATILNTENLQIGYRRGREKYSVQRDLNLQLFAGEMLCLIGPNGSGKTTLLRTLSGLQHPLGGDVKINNKPVADYSQKELARQIALVLTDKVEIENATVWDVVALGQQPYSHWLGGLSSAGRVKIEESIQLVHLEHKRKSLLSELSDGERQRVMIAKALAQDTPLIFLDEPTAHLDLPNRVVIMHLLHRLAHDTGKSIIISTHELDLALQAADRIWLMATQGGVISGVPEDLVLDGSFNRVFQNDSYYFNKTNGNFSMNYKLSKKVSVISEDKTALYWTFRALARAGYSVEEQCKEQIEIKQDGWLYRSVLHPNIEELLAVLP